LPDGRERFSFFDRDEHLLAESALGASSPAVAYDYVWFDDRPIAQLDATGTSWTYADHLGTPLIQTGANGSITWQAEHEAYGTVWALRSGDTHQPLRLPGQSSEQFDTGANGATSLSYNNARWYRPDFGRYTQADPIGLVGGSNLYAYVDDAPALTTDFFGLRKRRKKDLTCQELLQKITNLENQVNDRIFDMVIDKLGQRYQPFYIPGDEFKPGMSRGGHIDLLNKHSVAAQKLRERYAKECEDDEPPGGSCPAPAPVAAPNNDNAKNGAAAAATLVIIYWVVSEGSRLFPPRNLVPVL